MNNQNDKHTRLERRKKRKEDRFLNILIAAVVIAIVVIAFIVLPGDKEKSKEEQVKEDDQEIIEQEDEQEDLDEPEEDATEREEEEAQSEADGIEEDNENNEEPADVEVTENPNDPVVAKSIVDPAWSPIGTSQQGEHVSLYDGESVDWQEKVQALTYTTGLPEDDMIVWRLKNGGSPQKSIGIVSSKDKAEKYRVYLEWVDGEGWQPVKMDLLETLDFDY